MEQRDFSTINISFTLSVMGWFGKPKRALSKGLIARASQAKLSVNDSECHASTNKRGNVLLGLWDWD